MQRRSGRPQPSVASGHQQGKSPVLSDRELHDRVITYLSDANLRSTGIAVEFLEETEAERAERFSRFLARRYYRDRLQRAFRYSAAITRTRRGERDVSSVAHPPATVLWEDPSPASERPAQLGTSALMAEHVVEAPEFETVLENCVLGSLTTARAVAALATKELLPLCEDAWWGELLDYESAFFLQLATSEHTPTRKVPQKSISIIVHEFAFSIPALIASLRRGKVPSEVSPNPCTLLFSRTHHGKIYVVEPDTVMLKMFQAVDGQRSPDEIAGSSGISPEDVERLLNTLSDIGAVVLSAR